MSATTLYVKACRCLYSNESSKCWEEMLTLLPQIRSALSCRVCRGLIVDPQSSKYCQHYVCKECLKKKKALNPGCKWCLDWSKLRQSNRQVRVVLACYKLLCETIQSSHSYKNTVNDASIDMLLDEAISNQDKLPESNNVPSNDSGVLLGNLENTPADLGSRDAVETCARENVTKNPNKPKRGRKPGTKRKLPHCKATALDGSVKHLTNITAMSEKCLNQTHVNDDQPTTKNSINVAGQCEIDSELKPLGPVEIKPLMVECETNNNETKQPFVHKYTVSCNNMKSFPKTRKQSLLRGCDQVRFKKKRNLQQGIGGSFKKNSAGIKRSVNEGWKLGKPRKQYKMDLDNYNKRSIGIHS